MRKIYQTINYKFVRLGVRHRIPQWDCFAGDGKLGFVNDKGYSKISKGKTEIVKLKDRQDHGQQNENERQTYNIQNYTEKLKMELHKPYKNQDELRCIRRKNHNELL